MSDLSQRTLLGALSQLVLILQFEIQLKQRILKDLLQGQRPVPYQRGPAALVSCPNRKML